MNEATHSFSCVYGFGMTDEGLEPGDMRWSGAGERDLILVKADGRILVRGELVENDSRVGDAVRVFAESVLELVRGGRASEP